MASTWCTNGNHSNGGPRSPPRPLEPTGALEQFEYEDSTPVVGREYPRLNIVDDVLNSKDADALIKDIAIAISQRCVVFFRSQNNLTDELQREFVKRLGELSGKPADSTFFVNPIQPRDRTSIPEITKISSVGRSDFAKDMPNPRRFDEALWHADGQFEPFPPSFTSLRLSEVPKTGGDTLWASGYEIYDRFSKPLQSFLEGLTATLIGDGYTMSAEKFKDRMQIHEGPRGNPGNVGGELKAVHPVVRTHPVSGWKCIFPVGPRDPRDFGAPKYINELNTQDSERIMGWFYDMILHNHDLTVRFKWKNANDMAIWDNRCTFHSATFDYDGLGERVGARVAGVGERPYFDPQSKSRTEALAGQ